MIGLTQNYSKVVHILSLYESDLVERFMKELSRKNNYEDVVGLVDRGGGGGGLRDVSMGAIGVCSDSASV